MDRIDYLKDQLSVVCAEVAALQKKALAVTDELDMELESGSPANRYAVFVCFDCSVHLVWEKLSVM